MKNPKGKDGGRGGTYRTTAQPVGLGEQPVALTPSLAENPFLFLPRGCPVSGSSSRPTSRAVRDTFSDFFVTSSLTILSHPSSELPLNYGVLKGA